MQSPSVRIEEFHCKSFTAIICKLREKIIKNNIIAFLDKYNFLTKHRHGLKNIKSCTKNLIETLEFATQVISQKDQLDLISLDFYKVTHKRLLLKMSKYGITCKVLNWIEAFLTNRHQRVVLGESISEKKDVLSCVPQGSVISPLLSIIFIKELSGNLSNITKIYAYDTKVLERIRKYYTEQDALLMQGDINIVFDWTSNCKV